MLQLRSLKCVTYFLIYSLLNVEPPKTAQFAISVIGRPVLAPVAARRTTIPAQLYNPLPGVLTLWLFVHIVTVTVTGHY